MNDEALSAIIDEGDRDVLTVPVGVQEDGVAGANHAEDCSIIDTNPIDGVELPDLQVAYDRPLVEAILNRICLQPRDRAT
jgi:hypothetical protein